MKKFTVAIIGCGSRGAEAYGRAMLEDGERFSIVALCDVSAGKLKKYGEIFSVPEASRFEDEGEFFREKRADVLVLATMDNDHVRQCKRALELGYDVLLEKPITSDERECEELIEAQKRYGGKVVVCRVLRYAPAYRKLKELLEKKVCGELVMIDSIEQVCYWHQAHSFVRGNWRNSAATSPMILQKCCHDLDLLQYYADSKCETLSSIGDLRHFRAENKPAGASDRCLTCPHIHTCVYSAEEIYIGNWKAAGSPENCWPYNAVTLAQPLTEEAIRAELQEGPYGRCVYACDNDVVDHQIVAMTFENGVKASLRMTAFTAGGGRVMRFYCTKGQINYSDVENEIAVLPFNQPEKLLSFQEMLEGGHNHGGGDEGLIQAFYAALTGAEDAGTSLARSVESHLMAIRAEQSRKSGGELVRVHRQD